MSVEKKICILTCSFVAFTFSACMTTKDMETNVLNEEVQNEVTEVQQQKNEEELEALFIEQEMKVQDVANTVVFVEKPVYQPESKASELDRKNSLTGIDAVVESEKEATVMPSQYQKGTFFYQYNENLVYEVYAQPYHLTDIILEKGEVVIANPLLSEDDGVWELTAGVAKDPVTQEDIQHLFVKPAYTNLDSTMVIITDRRVYHLRLKSNKSTHMAIVKFRYPASKNVWATKESRKIENDFITVSNPEYLSFDYTIKYNVHKKPEFLPTRIYDDGKQTYIQVNPIVLTKKLPVLFNEKSEIINYSVKKNVFVIPRLVDKVTLRLGKEKVVIEKKITKANKISSEQQKAKIEQKKEG